MVDGSRSLRSRGFQPLHGSSWKQQRLQKEAASLFATEALVGGINFDGCIRGTKRQNAPFRNGNFFALRFVVVMNGVAFEVGTQIHCDSGLRIRDSAFGIANASHNSVATDVLEISEILFQAIHKVGPGTVFARFKLHFRSGLTLVCLLTLPVSVLVFHPTHAVYLQNQ